MFSKKLILKLLVCCAVGPLVLTASKPDTETEVFVVERPKKKNSTLKKIKQEFVEALEELAHMIPQEIIDHVSNKSIKHTKCAVKLLAECEDEILWRFREFIDQDSEGVFSGLGRAELQEALQKLLSYNKKLSLSQCAKIADLEQLLLFLRSGNNKK